MSYTRRDKSHKDNQNTPFSFDMRLSADHFIPPHAEITWFWMNTANKVMYQGITPPSLRTQCTTFRPKMEYPQLSCHWCQRQIH